MIDQLNLRAMPVLGLQHVVRMLSALLALVTILG
jgi:hypothetical protein